MVLADTLSHLPEMQNKEQLNLSSHVDSMHMDLMNFSQE